MPPAAGGMGCIERESEMGALYTDFTLIKAGSLHRANGGFCIIRVDDLSTNAGAWEGLLRALRSGLARVEDPAEGGEHVRTRTIEPEPIPLDMKVVLVGSDEAYELLLYSDERFGKLFKLKAHLRDTMRRVSSNPWPRPPITAGGRPWSSWRPSRRKPSPKPRWISAWRTGWAFAGAIRPRRPCLDEPRPPRPGPPTSCPTNRSLRRTPTSRPCLPRSPSGAWPPRCRSMPRPCSTPTAST